jgi:hypothetical protein
MIFERDPMDRSVALKPIEYRRWRTDYRGPLWIHAGKSMASMDGGLRGLRNMEIEPPAEFVFGALVGLVELVDCRPQGTYVPDDHDHQWQWVLERPRRLVEPIPMRGAPGLFDVPARVLAAAELERRCRECGCTDEEGCAEGCWWVRDDLCSQCGEREDHESTRARNHGRR